MQSNRKSIELIKWNQKYRIKNRNYDSSNEEWKNTHFSHHAGRLFTTFTSSPNVWHIWVKWQRQAAHSYACTHTGAWTFTHTERVSERDMYARANRWKFRIEYRTLCVKKKERPAQKRRDDRSRVEERKKNQRASGVILTVLIKALKC